MCSSDRCQSDSSGACTASDYCTTDKSQACGRDQCDVDASGACQVDICKTDRDSDCTAQDICTVDLPAAETVKGGDSLEISRGAAISAALKQLYGGLFSA